MIAAMSCVFQQCHGASAAWCMSIGGRTMLDDGCVVLRSGDLGNEREKTGRARWGMRVPSVSSCLDDDKSAAESALGA